MKIRGNTIATPIARHAVTDDSVISRKPWSSKNTVDKLCPDFNKTGSAVRCEPVEGYPLEVVASEEATQIIRCGKNIFDIATAGVYHNNSMNYWCDMYVTETGLRLEPLKEGTSDWSVFGFYLGTAKELAGKTITVSGRVNTTTSIVPKPFVRTTSVEPTSVRNKPTYHDGGYVGATNTSKTMKEGKTENGYGTVTCTVTGEEQYPYIAILFQLTYGGSYEVGAWTEWSDIQVEIGDTATVYESYRGDTFEPNEPITSLKGINTLYADSGEITVKGKADPVVITENLVKATSVKYELIEDITLAETVANFKRNTSPDGGGYNFTAVRIIVDAQANTTAGTMAVVMYKGKDYTESILQTNIGAINTDARCTYYKCYNDSGFLESCYASSTEGGHTGLSRRLSALDTEWQNIKSLELRCSANIPAGTRIRIYAIRG